jgi:multidrug resistance efflux pump
MNSPYRVHPALPSETAKPFAFPVPPQANRLAQLVKLEGELRQLPGWQATVFHALNETQDILGHAQAFFFRANNRGAFCCETVSAVASVDARAPFITALNSLINRMPDASKSVSFDLNAQLKSKNAMHPKALWLPMQDASSKVFAGLLLLRDDAWVEDVKLVAARLAGAYGHALRVHRPPQLLRSLSLPRWALWGLPAAVLALALIPVPLTTLAPFEIVPRDPTPVAAPLDGVIADIAAEPNTEVHVGDTLFRLETTELAATVAVAWQRVGVAEMRLATARNGAFADQEMKRAIGTLEKEFELAKAEHDLAKSRLARASIVATSTGLLVYSSRNDWLGKPVRVGERVMDIADARNVGVRVDVGMHDAVALEGGEGMRLFFDSDPLRPRRAVTYEKSFHAVERTSGQLTYTIRAMLEIDDAPVPRIGLRGTAQLIGQTVPLGFYLLRRPIAALRQHFGL